MPSGIYKRTEETRAKLKTHFLSISGNPKGHKWSEDVKRKISEGNKGKNKKGHPQTKETREKISKAKRGKPFSGIRSDRRGTKLSEETKEKMRHPHKKGSGIYLHKQGLKKGIKFSEEHKQKMRHPHKHKDISLLKKDPRKDLDTQYKYWRKEIRKRDRNVCKLLSNECNGRIETHHIFDWINYPELRYVINNGITLCAFHHPRGREEEKRMIPIFQELLSVSKE